MHVHVTAHVHAHAHTHAYTPCHARHVAYRLIPYRIIASVPTHTTLHYVAHHVTYAYMQGEREGTCAHMRTPPLGRYPSTDRKLTGFSRTPHHTTPIIIRQPGRQTDRPRSACLGRAGCTATDTHTLTHRRVP